MAELTGQTFISSSALRFLILTAARTSEVLQALWTEIDLDQALWVVSAERMKAGREHRVPLSDAALAVVREMAEIRSGPFVFPGAKQGAPLSNMAFAALMRRMGNAEFSVHGFRSGFRDWAAEVAEAPRELAEMALAHAITSAVEAAYRRGDLLARRRRLMSAWAFHCCGGSDASGHS
jgi:integrase